MQLLKQDLQGLIHVLIETARIILQDLKGQTQGHVEKCTHVIPGKGTLQHHQFQ